MSEFLTKQTIATLFLILMCVQYVPIEGHTISYVKFGAMCIAPFIWAFCSPKITKAFVWGMLYFMAVAFSSIFHPETFRFSTIGYLFSFICMFIMYYNLVYQESAFSLDYFMKLIKGLIVAYTVCLIIQQGCIVVGVKTLPLINLTLDLDRYLGVQSLSLEPSHSARVMTVLFLALLRMYEVKWGRDNVLIKKIYQDAKWVLFGFLWSMLTMGSGTAFVGLAILSLYFVKQRYLLTIAPMLAILYFVIPYTDIKPLKRAIVTLEAAVTLDSKKISAADLSASARVLPFVYTLDHFDLYSQKTWFGEGVDAGVNNDIWSRKRMIGGMSDYGFLSYILALIFVFSICIRRFISIETLVFVVLLMGEIRSIYIWWAAFMLFTTIKYFQTQKIEKE